MSISCVPGVVLENGRVDANLCGVYEYIRKWHPSFPRDTVFSQLLENYLNMPILLVQEIL